MHVLARRIHEVRLVACADWAGFTVFGQVPTDILIEAVTEGLERMRAGEKSLVLHPNCGTNIAVPLGLCGGLVIGAVSLPRNWRFTRFFFIFLAGVAFAHRKRLSQQVQKALTTTTNLDITRLRSVRQISLGKLQITRVVLQN